MSLRQTLLVLFAFLFVIVLASAQSTTSKAKNQSKISALRNQRRDVLKERLKAVQAAFEVGQRDISELLAARVDLVEAELQCTSVKSERIDLCKRHVAAVQQIEAQVKLLRDAGRRGGEIDKYLVAKAARLAAEIALLEEQQ